jgi:ribosome recycling factor
MLFNENELKRELDDVVNSLAEDMKSIRTGRASNDTFEKILVDYYGTKTPLTYIAQITFNSAISITVKLNDKNAASEVKKALDEANIGGSIVESEKGVFKINFNPLTEEDRKLKVKELGFLLEEKRIRARHVRQRYMEEIKSLDKVSEDDQKRSEERVQKMLDEHIAKLETLAKDKESDLLAV